MGQVFENGAFGIEVSIRSKLSFSERFVCGGIQGNRKKSLSHKISPGDVKCVPQKMGTGMAKGEMAKTEIGCFFFLPRPCSLKELVLAEITLFSLNQTDTQRGLSVVRN